MFKGEKRSFCSAFVSTKFCSQRKAYEGNPEMFYTRTTEVKQMLFGIARSFLANLNVRR